MRVSRATYASVTCCEVVSCLVLLCGSAGFLCVTGCCMPVVRFVHRPLGCIGVLVGCGSLGFRIFGLGICGLCPATNRTLVAREGVCSLFCNGGLTFVAVSTGCYLPVISSVIRPLVTVSVLMFLFRSSKEIARSESEHHCYKCKKSKKLCESAFHFESLLIKNLFISN